MTSPVPSTSPIESFSGINEISASGGNTNAEPKVNEISEPLNAETSDVAVKDNKSSTRLPPPGHVSLEALRCILAKLQQRVSCCEALLGQPTDVGAALQSAGARDELPEGTFDGRRTEWLKKLRAAVNEQPGVAAQLSKLQKLVDQILSGKLAIFQRKLSELRCLMQNNNASLHMVLRANEARQAYILNHADDIGNMAMQLKQLDELRTYVNHPSYTAACAARERILRVEERALILAERAKTLEAGIVHLAAQYAGAMNSLGLVVNFLQNNEPVAQR